MIKEQPLSETCSTSLLSSLVVSLKLKSCGKERFTLHALWHLGSDSWENSKLPKKMKTVSPCSFHMYHLNSSVISSFELSRSFQYFKKNFSLMGSFDGFSETSFCSVLHLLFLDVNRHMSVLVSVLISLQPIWWPISRSFLLRSPATPQKWGRPRAATSLTDPLHTEGKHSTALALINSGSRRQISWRQHIIYFLCPFLLISLFWLGIFKTLEGYYWNLGFN